jgi:hypothetical protein
MVSSTEREKEKREEREKRFCVWKFKLVVFPWWLVHPDEGGMSVPTRRGRLFTCLSGRTKKSIKQNISLERTLTDKTFIQIEKNIP